MPKRTDIQSIMIIGAGPIIIGQACEFDYSGTQACKALKEEGYRVILVNSNPATIMTDPGLADATYVEPITPEVVEKILEKEKPDALLPTMGGQTALNTALALAESGALDRLNVQLIGANREAISKAEDRDKFRTAMMKIGLDMPISAVAHSLEEAWTVLEEVKLPCIIRPSFTMGGTGGGIAYNREEFETIIASGLDASPTTEVLVEESIVGWKEYEMEVVRDQADNCIIICSIENVDPMGVHTGDSITVAPALTLTDKEYQIMRNASLAVLREIGVETGGSNVQFAVNPENGRLIIIEMNPRVSRSSALASKATGFPIAKIAAKLAVGYTLDELDNDITGSTPASFEPTIDYVVTKIPRFTFEKFQGAEAILGTAMKSVGEAMAVGRTFQESLQKALRSLETGLTGLNETDIGNDKQGIMNVLAKSTPDRLLNIAQAFRAGLTFEEIKASSKFEPWFLSQIESLVLAEEAVREKGLPTNKGGLLTLKKMGFSDARLAEISGKTAEEVSALRATLDVQPVYKKIDTCAGEFTSQTPYLYSTFEGNEWDPAVCEAMPTDRKKVIILGGGPNRIGQGIEFDYCCVHAAYAMEDAGYESIMVNCNPETVSTDYDTSDRLYFEPLTIEDTLAIIRKEQSNGSLHGVIVQFGGQTPLKLAAGLEAAGVPILGTSPDAIDLAEDRERFQQLLHKLGLVQPENGIARSVEEAFEAAHKIGYPVVVRPSYVLGGRAMEIVRSDDALNRYMTEAVQVSGENPVLIDGYLQNAIEVDVDCLCDGKDVYVAGIMEHIEEAGIHSGDSACALPPYTLSEDTIAEIRKQSESLAIALNVVGLMNVQFAVKEGTVYILEVNPRASRTVPFVAKSINYPIAKIAARIMAGETLASFNLEEKTLDHVTVKEAVFPFARFPGVDVILGPEMRSTGEVMGIDKDFASAFLKSQMAAGVVLPTSGNVFISVKDLDKPLVKDVALKLVELGFSLVSTAGTAAYFEENGIDVSRINKVMEGRPNIVDFMKNGEIAMVINTTEGVQALKDSYDIRHTALVMKTPYSTTIAGARASAMAIEKIKSGTLEVNPLQSYS
ncbi:carbamoyl-phosphate synthase large subunit [Sneathiella aquimaris]|uniref:carbamoyl-phosphate synthase large subunit n=1 Tax=Sneathiella aquimaris TaxID=2599305 RepID=UPI00146D5D06|nr:carbamoyl-phosphate synthase large subunit [Sneathiella aquimaris]